jgi:tellurite methyltransferase
MCNTPLIDVRSEAEFLRGHEAGAVNVPVEDLARRVHELPAKARAVRLVDSDERRARRAEEFFLARCTAVRVERFDPSKQTEIGPSTLRLWEPSPFLVEALDAVARRQDLAGLSAVDIACGTGRDAVYMATRGLRVTGIDVLPDALERAQDLARRSGVSVATIAHDLEKESTLPDVGPAYVVTVFRYLHRPLFPALAALVVPGGLLIYETFHQRNLETGKRPKNPEHLLETGELPRHFPAFEILIHRDAWERDGRFFSSLLARRPDNVR